MLVANQEIAIRERAYAIWEAEGRPEGRDWDHWYRAMQELTAPAPKSAATKAAPKAKPRKATKGRFREALKAALS